MATALMAARISGVKDVFQPAEIEPTTDEAVELEMLQAIEFTSEKGRRKAVPGENP